MQFCQKYTRNRPLLGFFRPILLLTVIFIPSITSAATYYLSAGGSDSNVGSITSPWATMGKAKASVRAGDTVILGNGTYGAVIFSDTDHYGSSWNLPIVYKAANNSTPVFTKLHFSPRNSGLYLTFDGITIKSSGIYLDSLISNLRLLRLNVFRSWGDGGDGIHMEGSFEPSGFKDILIDGCEVKNAELGIKVEGNVGKGLVISNNQVHRISGSGISIKAKKPRLDPILLDGNHVYHQDPRVINGRTVHGTGISIRSDHLTLRNNIVHDYGNTAGIRTYQNIFPSTGYQNMLFENNLVYDTRNFPIQFIDPGNNFIVRNNTFIGHRTGRDRVKLYESAFFIKSEGPSLGGPLNGTGVEVYNNIFAGQSSIVPQFSQTAVRNNIAYAGTSGTNGITYYPGTGPASLAFEGAGNFFTGGSNPQKFDRYSYSGGPHQQNLDDAFQTVPNTYAYNNSIGIDYNAMGSNNNTFSLNFIGNKTIGENQSLVFTISASNPNNAPLSYTAANLPLGAHFTNQTFSWTPTNLDAGNHSITFTVSNGPLQNSETIILTVGYPPVLAPLTNQSINDNTLLAFTVTASDADGNSLTFLAKGLPPGATFDTLTGLFSWTPHVGQTANYPVTFTVSDGVYTDSQTITLAANPPAPSATWTSSAVWENRSMTAQTGRFTFEFDAVPQAANIDGLTGLSNGPAGSYNDLAITARFNINGTLDARNGNLYTTDRVIAYQSGLNYHFRLVVDIPNHTYDIYVTPQGAVEEVLGTGYAFRTLQNTTTLLNYIALAPGGPHMVSNLQFSQAPGTSNQAPILNPIGNKTVIETNTLTFNVSATDPDNDPISYSATNLPNGAVFTNQTFSWTPNTTDVGNHSMTFIASDSTLQDSETITITVNRVPPPPPSPATPELVLDMTLNGDPANGVLDSSSYHNSGTANGNVALAADRNGQAAQAYNFDGSGDFISIPHAPIFDIDRVTAAAWIYQRTSGDDRVICKSSGTAVADHIFSLGVIRSGGNQSKIRVRLTTDSGSHSFDGTASFATNTWTHVAFTYDGQNIRIYVNGIENGTFNATGLIKKLPIPVVIGNVNLIDNRYFDGVIDDVRIYNFALSANEISSLASTGSSPPPTNSPPVLVAIGNQSTYENTPLIFSVSASDADGDSITYSAQNLPSGALFANQAFTWTPTYTQAGDHYQVTITASDGQDQTSETINITVLNVNRPPTLAAIPDQQATRNAPLNFKVSASDPDSDTINYSVQNMPTGATFANQVFSWIPDTTANKINTLTFVASDGQDQGFQTITIIVANINQPPVLDPIGNQMVDELSSLNLTLNATDADGDPLSFSATNLPAGATLKGNLFSWIPTLNQAGTYQTTFTVSDNKDIDSETVIITVNNFNQVPVLNTIEPIDVMENIPIRFIVSASDPDGDILTYSVEGLDLLTGATFENQTFNWTPDYDSAGNYPLTFSVSDGQDTTTGTIILTINNVNRLPVLDTMKPIAVMENVPISFVLSASDPDGDILTYSVEGLDLLTGATFENQTFNWTPGYESAGNYLVIFNISDGQDTISQDVIITILNDNRPPLFTPIGDRLFKVGDLRSFEIFADDPDGDPITYSVTDLPNGAVFTNQTFSWTADAAQAGHHLITFMASDGHDMVSETITITVQQDNIKPLFVPINHTPSVQENSEITFTVSATDENNDPLTYSAQNLPTGANFVDQTFTWRPDFDAAGEYALTFVVSDGILEDLMTTPLIVQNTNRAPQFQPLNDIITDETQQIQLDLMATDPDGEPLSFSVLASLPGNATLNANTFNWALQDGDSGTYSITFIASDGELEATATTTITVNHLNQPPIINVPTDLFVNQYSTLTIPIPVTDPENDPVEVTVQNLPTGATFANDLISWTPGDSQNGTTQIIIEASDGQLVSSATVTLYVMAITLDTTPPFVSYTSPADQAIQVPLNPLLVMEVADSDSGIDANSVVIQMDGQDIYRGNVTEYSSSLGKTTRYGNTAIYKYSFQLTQMLRSDQKVTLTAKAKDLRGNAMPAYATSFSTEMMVFGGVTAVNLANDGQPQSHPVTTQDPLGNIWTAWQSGPVGTSRIVVTRLVAGATTFENSLQLPASGDQAHPAVATDSNGQAYLCWQEKRQGVWNIYAATSTDGVNWSAPLPLAPSPENQTQPVMATNPLAPGAVYIAYQQETDNVQDIHLVSSLNALSSVSLTAITHLATQQINPDIVVANGTVYIVWTDLRYPTTSIYGASSASGWLNTPIVNQASNQSQPSLAAEDNGNRLHLVWTDDQSGNQDIFYANSSNGFDDAPLTGVSLIDDTTSRNQYHASIAAIGSGSNVRVFVGWQDERNSPIDSDIYFVDVTASSDTNILVTTDTSNTNQSTPVLGVNPAGNPYLLWVDARGTDDDIYYGGATNIAGVQMAAADVTQQNGGVVGTSFENITNTQDVSAEIPAGALWSDARITITKIDNPAQTSDISSVLSSYEFGPSSELEFAKPVTLTIPYKVANNQSTNVFWYNSRTGELSQSGLSSIENIEITPNLWAIRFKTTHFSQYLIGEQQTKTKGKGSGSGSKSKK